MICFLGRQVYEERRQESLQIMDGLKNKCEKIQSVITGMEVHGLECRKAVWWFVSRICHVL